VSRDRLRRGAVFQGWLSVAKRSEGSILLSHLGQHHPDQVGVYLDQMRGSEDIG
jgi:hypothetical protein